MLGRCLARTQYTRLHGIVISKIPLGVPDSIEICGKGLLSIGMVSRNRRA